jgi:hypothetical protein
MPELDPLRILITCISPGYFIPDIAGGRMKIAAARRALDAQSLIGRVR